MNLIFSWQKGNAKEPESKVFPYGYPSESSVHNWVNWAIALDLITLKNGTVHSMNTLKGDVTIIAGANIEILDLPGSNSIQISSTGGGGAGSHMHTGMGWTQRTQIQGEKRGCTMFNGYLYVTGFDPDTLTNRIFKIDPADFSVIESWQSQSSYPWDLAHDATYIYETDNNTKNLINRYDPVTQEHQIITLGEPTTGYLHGIEFDTGQSKFFISDDKGYIYIYSADLQTLETQESLPEGGNPIPSSLTYDSLNAWIWISLVWNYNSQKIMAISASSRLPKAILQNFGDWLGIAYDQGYFFGTCKGANSTYWLFKTNEARSVL